MLSFRKLYITVSITICLLFVFNSLNAQDTLANKKWLRFNVQAALVANNSFSNLSFPFLYSEKAGQTSNYTKNSSKPICYGFNSGLEFIIGKDPVLKYIISATYDLTNSVYNNYWVEEPQFRRGEKQTYHLTVNRQVQFIGINGGLLFRLTKKLKLATIASFAFCTLNTDITNGYTVQSGYAQTNPNNAPGYYNDSTSYHNNKTTDNGLNFIFSFRIRASYDITKYLSVFVLRNLGLNYKAPWWMIGIQYYPFRKLR